MLDYILCVKTMNSGSGVFIQLIKISQTPFHQPSTEGEISKNLNHFYNNRFGISLEMK